MTKHLATFAAAVAALTCASSLPAHHSVSMIDVSKSVWVKGTVVRYEPINPHARIALEETTDDGRVQQWTIEGPFPGRLARILSLNGLRGDEHLLRPGDVIEVCGFFPKRARVGSVDPDAPPLRYVHGHVIVMPDGRMQSWGPYGKLDNCVRPNERPEPWLDFLQADPLAREFWCNVPAFVGVASTAPNGFVDDVNERLTDPCAH